MVPIKGCTPPKACWRCPFVWGIKFILVEDQLYLQRFLSNPFIGFDSEYPFVAIEKVIIPELVSHEVDVLNEQPLSVH